MDTTKKKLVKTYAVDIDGTICKTQGNDYINSQPIPERIEKINNLYFEGNQVFYYTARGMESFKGNIHSCYAKHYEFTYKQLLSWGCKFTGLILGKLNADQFIDDKGINDKDFF